MGADANNRSNAFEVYTDGHAEIQTMGSTDKSITTKKYVDDKIAEIPSGGAVDDVQINGESTVISGWKVEKKPDEDGYIPIQEEQPGNAHTLRERVTLLESTTDDMILLMAELIGGV